MRWGACQRSLLSLEIQTRGPYLWFKKHCQKLSEPRVWRENHGDKSDWLLFLESALKRGGFQLLEMGCCHFYFHPLKWWEKPSGNKSYTEQSGGAYTEPSPLARGKQLCPSKDNWESKQQVLPPEYQQENLAKTKFTDYTQNWKLQNSSAKGKLYIEFIAFFLMILCFNFNFFLLPFQWIYQLS